LSGKKKKKSGCLFCFQRQYHHHFQLPIGGEGSAKAGTAGLLLLCALESKNITLKSTYLQQIPKYLTKEVITVPLLQMSNRVKGIK